MYNLFLDDWRSPKTAFDYMYNSDYLQLEWIIVKDYDEFTNHIIEHGLPDKVSFDHDLADEHYDEAEKQNGQDFDYNAVTEKTGYDCAKWLIQYCINNKKPLSKYLIHTGNIVGADNIKFVFKNFEENYDKV